MNLQAVAQNVLGMAWQAAKLSQNVFFPLNAFIRNKGLSSEGSIDKRSPRILVSFRDGLS
jgi:hypothetical protein